jgi:hypothetical protein
MVHVDVVAGLLIVAKSLLPTRIYAVVFRFPAPAPLP